MTIQEIENNNLIPLYGKRDIALVKGEGVYLWDENNHRYLDFTSNYGANVLGYGHKYFTDQIIDQLSKLTNVHSSFFNDVRAQLLEKLNSIIPLKKFFICSTGTEAVEAALKFAMLATGRNKFIGTNNAYHGRTLGSLSATGIAKYKEGFPRLAEFAHVPYDNTEALATAITNDTAAVILEPIQGEGGVRIPADDYLSKVRELCDTYGVLLILDEIQTGFRTGSWLFGKVSSDIICLSKGLGNGFPIGLTGVTEEVAAKIPKGSHGTTFGSNPLVCRAALATINEIENNNLHQRVRELGDYLASQLNLLQSPIIREVRGRGFMVAIECKEKAGQYVKALQDKGLLVMSSNNVLRLLPPLVMSRQDIDQGIEIIKEVLCARK